MELSDMNWPLFLNKRVTKVMKRHTQDKLSLFEPNIRIKKDRKQNLIPICNSKQQNTYSWL